MKVLQLTAHFYPNLGGVETHLNDLVAELQQRNIQTYVLTYCPLTTKAKWKIYEKQKNLSILRIPWIRGLFYMFVTHPMIEFLYLLPGLLCVTPFIILTFRPNSIHTHGLVAGFVGVFWGKIFRKKVIITTHSIYHFPKSGLYHDFVSWLFRHTDHILVLSQQSKDEVERLGIPSRKITVFTYWVNQELFKPMNRQKQRIKFDIGKEYTVLFVGRLITEKGVLVLLDAFNQIETGMKLLIAGDGPLKQYVQENERKNSHIKYLGKVEQKDLPSLYNAADVVVVPSIHEEGFGRIILEALSCGTPVIASKRGGIIEAMDSSVGMLIPMTAKDLVSAFKKIHGNPELLVEKRKNAISFANERFSKSNVNAIINSYES
jgi:glycosyltransferase involved in cell wall biosynthesis